MRVESVVGEGSLFSFTIPVKPGDEEVWKSYEALREQVITAMPGEFSILVVEDNPSNQIVTLGLLEKILPEAVVEVAENGPEALGCLVKRKYDLVFMDIQMPGMDGFEVTRRLRSMKNDNAAVPVVALTASVIRSDIQKCLDAGMNAYVPKPVGRSALAKAVREQLNISGSVQSEPAPKQDFLNGIGDLPAWAPRLAELCNGKKERFIRYLNIFIEQQHAGSERWAGWLEAPNPEALGFSLHRMLPYTRLFLRNDYAIEAASLEAGLRESGITPAIAEKIIGLKEVLAASATDARNVLARLG